ncbi:hypothetical protein OCK02_23175 [Rhizobium sp. TRM96647]|uniref:hypothetical protein n=1 Tax=unclassified Rhizobium TaxID=2613769 RepID=UPI0021E9383A|nr:MULTISPECIES: hypothetical protein [unclassified Rhizobium]MCV3739080.1 hypothetical protein [Rhizobium sp. TRM96647]MCV3760777.1 hypothetical protein [Rhizobium sp. TRM96650]
MTFTEANIVEAHLRDLLAGAASTRPAQLSTGLARAGGKIAGLGLDRVAPAKPDFLSFQHPPVFSRGRQLQ